MIATGIALAALLVTLPTGSAPPNKPSTKAAPIHKSKVPVTVTTVFGAGKAIVTLRFDQAVTEAAIGLRGLDGLQVTSTPTIDKTSFIRGELLTLEVSFSPGPGRSHLAVDIEGRFRGQRRMGVQTFAVGTPSADQQKTTEGTLVTTTDGQRIKLMPVKQQ